MTLNSINDLLASLNQKKRENVFAFASALMEWMQIAPVAKEKPPLLSPATQKLMEALLPAPLTVQPQLYRLSKDNQNIKLRFAVLKKLKKEYISLLVDNDPGLTSFQASMRGIINIPGREPYIASEPYFIHFVTTGAYDRLLVIINQGDQKRIVQFKDRLSNTQYHKILSQWQNIGTKSKPEITDSIWKSLDIKEVNKDFYKQIKERFDAAIGIAKTQYPQAKEQDVKQFAVRLIGRYIFCWFLKEKEIIPANLLSSNTIKKYQGTYFQTYLFHLYFNTLNEDVQSRKTFNTNSELDSLYLNIPYLNGGLFDKHTEDELFDKIDLNAWLINFVEILESFDFTVDESSSQYQLVAIDPEMLGRIFENLLASQNQETEKLANQRKAFGAFYTPREIVDYMVNESLKAHIETQLLPKEDVEPNIALQEPLVSYKGSLFAHLEPQQTVISFTQPADYDKERKRERLKTKIEKLFAPDCVDNPFDKAETQQVRKALTEVKVLDPACGSGAFPMGMLLRLMELRQIVGHGHRNNYELKSEILNKNIFGVDIMPMAVEIARLRAWLSLVLEADYKPTDRKNNFGVSALPNLDFKFVCANSLVDSGYDTFLKLFDSQLQISGSRLAILNQEIIKLEKIRDDYFDTKGDLQLKDTLKKAFFEHKNFLKQNFNTEEFAKNEKGKEIITKKSTAESYNLKDFFSKIDDWNPFDDSHPSSFFSPAWMFGIKDGFDVVIGNPPYVDSETMTRNNPEFREYLKNTFSCAVGNWDLFVIFIQKSMELANLKGCLSFIIPNKIISAKYTYALREYLNKKSIRELIDYSNVDVFSEADVYPIVMLVNNNKEQNNSVITKVMHSLDNVKTLNTTASNIFVSDVFWDKFFFDKDILNLIIKLTLKPRLASYFPNILGAATVSEAYQIRDVIKELESESIYFKLINTGTIDPYLSLWGFKKTQYIKGNFELPIIKLDDLALINKNRVIQSKSAKIIIAGMAIRIEAFFDEFGEFCAGKSTTIILGNTKELKTLTAFLNSRIVSFWFGKYFNSLSMAGGYFNIGNNEIGLIPLPEKSVPNESINNLVDNIILLKKQKMDSTYLEKEIDVLVYKLYELTYDEVKIIDKEFWLSEEEYNNYKMQ